MSILVRKISRGKWPTEIREKNEFDGDTISDLRTTSNTLSLWRIKSEEDMESAFLALSASSKSETIEKIDVVWISEETLRKNGLTLVDDMGDTVVDDLANTHCDVANVTYKTLGDLAVIIAEEVINNNHCKRLTASKVKRILAKAYSERRIAEEKCTPEMLNEIKKAYDQYKNEL